MYHHDAEYYCPGRPPLHYATEFGIEFLVTSLLRQGNQVDDLVSLPQVKPQDEAAFSWFDLSSSIFPNTNSTVRVDSNAKLFGLPAENVEPAYNLVWLMPIDLH